MIGSLFPILISIVLFFGVLISAEDDDGGGNYSSSFGGMNLSAEVLKHQPMVKSTPENTALPSMSMCCWLSFK